MKLKSLVLGSVAAAGLSTGAFAADLSVLTSLDVCDALGISGLTISSDTNCLKISGSVDYYFRWGDYHGGASIGGPYAQYGNWGPPVDMEIYNTLNANGTLDWESRVRWNLRFEASADSEFGTAMAVVNFTETSHYRARYSGAPSDGVTWHPYSTGTGLTAGGAFTTYSDGIDVDEAYVQVGDSIVLMAGRKGTIADHGTDTPFGMWGPASLFGTIYGTIYDSLALGTYGVQPSPGVWVNNTYLGGGPTSSSFSTDIRLGGDVIQVTADLGNGFMVAGGLENIDDANTVRAGTLVGVIGYNGENVTAHGTFMAGGILDGTVEYLGFHGGIEARFDNVKIRGALAASRGIGGGTWIQGMAGIEAKFDMFTLSGNVEANNAGDVGISGTIGAQVTEDVRLNFGARYYNPNGGGIGDSFADLAAEVVAAVTETVTLTGRLGVLVDVGTTNILYGSGTVAWAPGGGFRTALTGEVQSTGGYRMTYTASKSFQ